MVFAVDNWLNGERRVVQIQQRGEKPAVRVTRDANTKGETFLRLESEHAEMGRLVIALRPPAALDCPAVPHPTTSLVAGTALKRTRLQSSA